MPEDAPALSLDTLAVHAGRPPAPPSGHHDGIESSRGGHRARHALETCLAALEGGQHGFAFGSGLGAASTLLHTLSPGSHVLSGDDGCGSTRSLLDRVMAPLGLTCTQVDMRDPSVVRAALRPETRLVWVETPTQAMLKVFDVAALAEIARQAGAPLVVDSTLATPVLQRPLELGATAVLHSTTRYLSGDADVAGAAVVTSDEALAERLRFLQNATGTAPGPFECHLILRGLKTLGVRVRQQCASAATIASKLEWHAGVARVHYPGLASHPSHALAARQMRAPGVMISLEVTGGLPAAQRFLERLQLFAGAESLGGVASLAEHPASSTHAAVPEAARRALGITDGFVRLSIGIEAEADLWADIDRALAG